MHEQALAEALIAALDRGRRTATHKLLLLLAILDELPLAFDASTGRPPTALSLRRLAHHVLDYSLRHTVPYESSDRAGEPLKQSSSGKSRFLRAAASARERAGVYDAKAGSADSLRRLDEVAYDRAIRRVIKVMVDNPIPRLQSDIGKEFLYAWPLGVQPKQAEFETSVGYQGVLELLPGVADDLTRLTPLLRPLIEAHYVRLVAKFNGDLGIEDVRVSEYLFGAERASLTKGARAFLHERDGGTCPYERELGKPQPQSRVIDHFLPWSRLRSNRVELLTRACVGCNTAKSDHLPAPRHVVAFVDRAAPAPGSAPGDFGAAMGLVASTYSAAPFGTPMWLSRSPEGSQFIDFDDEGRDAVLAAVKRRVAC